ncbi:MAG TPA: hypothetical protein VME47_24945 [Acetobacteraceae bacterium]|nr:hypothetical protein [Acetobacteraceae bacterium]
MPMRIAPKPLSKPRRQPPKPAPTYRGVRLPSIDGPSRFTRDQIRKAVATAIAKHADEIPRED